jgi:ribosomal protein S12 methylthiotransferase accessory factor
MTGDGGNGLVPHDSDDVAQFSPSFTVYLLPPDVVCLYSEHRKFFLHGVLYCAIAEAIGAGTTYQDLVRGLERHYPAEKVREALKRLADRKFVVRAERTAGGAAHPTSTYWASLGLEPNAVERQLHQFRVRIRSINVQGADELAAALSKLGVRVVNRSADLTVTLVSDYLEERLAELNRKHLADGTPWMLAQPSGIAPLVGPVFRPGDGACWACLAERMKRNREIKAFLDRKQARRVVISSLDQSVFGQGAIQLLAVEIAKAIATGFRTDLRDHIVSLDLLGSTIVRHYVTTRPQCPSCGRKELRDPTRDPAPVTLGAGGKLMMTSGGYRAMAPADTVARFRKHVSPLTGVVSRLERIQADLPLNTNYLATHNFSSRPETVDELKAGLGGGSYGKGSSTEQAEASALMEAIERYSGVFQGDEIRVKRRFNDFRPGEAILANSIQLFSAAQEQHGRPPFNPSAEIEWSPVWSLRDRVFRWIPTSILYFSYRDEAGGHRSADSNGCAAGNVREEAIVQGFLELVERDSYAIWWYNRLQRPEVDLDRFDDPYIRDLKVQFAQTGRRLWLLDVTSDLGIPSFVAVAHWMQGTQEQVEFGSGAHFEAHIAALRALTEINQFLSIGLMGGPGPEPTSDDGSEPFRVQDHAYLTPHGSPVVRPDFAPDFRLLDKRDQVDACVHLAKGHGLDFLVLDQTRPDIDVPVVRVIVPGLRHFYRRFAPGRLYDVPVKLGLRDLPLSESDLNQLIPKT